MSLIEVTCSKCGTKWSKRKRKSWTGLCIKCVNKGRKLAKEHKDKVSKSLSGRKLSLEHIRKMSENQRGEKGSNWQGGRTAISEIVRNLSMYKDWRKEIFSRDNYSCTICGKKSFGDIQADHIEPLSRILKKNNINSAEEAMLCDSLWDVNNGRTLCIKCHKKTDTYAGRLNKKLKENVV